MDTFPITEAPDWGLSEGPQADIAETKLGDGYVLRRPKGINYLKEQWSPTWSSLNSEDARETYQWLKSRLKLTAFFWSHPVTGMVYRVICTQVSLTYNEFNNEILSASFEQDFNL